MANIDPTKIISNLISGKGISDGKKLTGSTSGKTRKTPVHGAVSEAQKALGRLAGGEKRTSGSKMSSKTETADNRASYQADLAKAVAAGWVKGENGVLRRATSSKASTGSAGTARPSAAKIAAAVQRTNVPVRTKGNADTAKAKKMAARKTGNKKRARRMSRRVARRVMTVRRDTR